MMTKKGNIFFTVLMMLFIANITYAHNPAYQLISLKEKNGKLNIVYSEKTINKNFEFDASELLRFLTIQVNGELKTLTPLIISDSSEEIQIQLLEIDHAERIDVQFMPAHADMNLGYRFFRIDTEKLAAYQSFLKKNNYSLHLIHENGKWQFSKDSNKHESRFSSAKFIWILLLPVGIFLLSLIAYFFYKQKRKH